MKYSGPIFDVDVHHRWNNVSELVTYLPEEWRGFAEHVGVTPTILHYPFPFGTNKRLDTFGPDGESPGSSLGVMQEQLLDKFSVSVALLGYDAGQEMSNYNIPFTASVARAANEWSKEQWLTRDHRLRGAIMVPAQDPLAAAAEIRHWSGDDRFISVLIGDGALGLPLGHPVYDPIYEAAEEARLPIALHFGTPLWGGGGQLGAGGFPLNRLEYFTVLNHSGIHHVVSMVTNGVFEKFPKLKVLVLETGVSWLPWVLWQLDAAIIPLRRETPALRLLPSEYVLQHMLFATQPLEPGPRPADLVELLGTIEGIGEILCFASDYPHFDTDDAGYVERFFPSKWLDGLFFKNAEKFFKDRVQL